MANSKANIYNIALNGPLETNQYKGGIKQYQGFNEKNAFYRNNALTPFWKKETTADSSNVVFDNDGNMYYVKKTTTYGFSIRELFKKDVSGNETSLFIMGNIWNNNLQSAKKTVLFENGKNILAVKYISNNEYYYMETVKGGNQTYFHTVLSGADTAYFIGNPTARTIGNPTPFCRIQSINNKLFFIADWVLGVFVDGTIYTQRFDETYGYLEYAEFLPTDYVFSDASKSSFKYDALVYIQRNAANSPGVSIEPEFINFNSETPGLFQSYSEFYTSDGIKCSLSNYTIRGGRAAYSSAITATETTVYDFNFYSGAKETLSSGEAILDLKQNVLNNFVKTTWFLQTNSSTEYEKYITKVTPNGSTGYINNVCLDSEGYCPVSLVIKNKSSSNFVLKEYNGQIAGLGSDYNLFSDWFDVDDNFCINYMDATDICCYKTNNGQIVIIEISSDLPELKIYNNYILTTNLGECNAFDLQNKIIFNCSNFFCNNINAKLTIANSDPPSSLTLEGVYSKKDKTSFASGINAGYEVTQEYFPSILLNPLTSIACNTGTSLDIDSTYQLQNGIVDIYAGDDFAYLKSLVQVEHYGISNLIRSNLEGTTYPIDTSGNILYSPNLFTEYIESYINQDMVINGTTGYPLVYSNQKVVLGYYLLSEIENIDNIFVLQGQTYGIADNKIFSYSYSSGVISGINTICNITNYEFIGNTTDKAYFWNTVNKSIYVFTGANTLSLFSEGYEIGDIVVSAFDVTTDTVYIATETSVYLLNEQICELKVAGITDIYSWKKGFIFQSGTDVYFFSYVEEDGFTAENVEIETCFYGAGDNVVTINDCLYLRLYSANSEEGTVTITVTTVANEGITTEKTQFNIKSSDWDAKTNSVYLRYQPKKQRGLGSSFAISSPFAIAYMGVGATPDTLLVDKVSKGAVNSPAVVSSKLDF